MTNHKARRLSHQASNQGLSSSKAHPLSTCINQRGQGPQPIWKWTGENWKVTHSNYRRTTFAATSTFECHLNILWFWRIIPFPRRKKVQANYMPYIFRRHKYFPLFLHFSDLSDIMKTEQLPSKHWFLFFQ